LKWYWLTGRGQHGLNVALVVQRVDRGWQRILREKFSGLKSCRHCEKFDEAEILKLGFEPDRKFSIRNDLYSEVLDLPMTIASEQFRDVCGTEGIAGLQFHPCGFSPKVGSLFVLAPGHQADCSTPVGDWLRPTPLFATENPVIEWCTVCNRAIFTVGHPRLASLRLPDEMVITVPSIPLETRLGVNWAFLCSDQVRQILRRSGLKGCSFSEATW